MPFESEIRGISQAVEPLFGITRSQEAAGPGITPDLCKRLLPSQADPDVGSGM
jgi:hypothetical protein